MPCSPELILSICSQLASFLSTLYDDTVTSSQNLVAASHTGLASVPASRATYSWHTTWMDPALSLLRVIFSWKSIDSHLSLIFCWVSNNSSKTWPNDNSQSSCLLSTLITFCDVVDTELSNSQWNHYWVATLCQMKIWRYMYTYICVYIYICVCMYIPNDIVLRLLNCYR